MTVSKEFWVELVSILPISQTRWATSPLWLAWEQAENGVQETLHVPKHNPLNTTLVVKGSTDFNNNEPPVQNYVSRAQGVRATADTLLDPRHASIIKALRDGADPYYVAVTISRDPWGTNGWLIAQRLHDNGYGL